MKRLIMGLAALAAMVMGANASAQSTADNLIWPDLNSYHVITGDLINPPNVRRVVTGISKKQVRLLLNNPHTSEGLAGVHEWDYLFSFLTGNGSERVSCQYKVLFNKDMIVTSTHWRDEVCARFMADKVVNQTHSMTLGADGLFAFGRSGWADLQASGRARLGELAMQIKTGFSKVRQVTVSGYTDRIGSAADNMKLSQARAETVKQFLVSEGVSESLIRAVGRGASEPVVNCAGAKSPSVIECLAPNRRIVVSVNGDK
ncbi:MAG: ompA 8 [Burkholderiaceae bacterium]|nr:ompA 8 [Burkholderiaceae bacterium]